MNAAKAAAALRMLADALDEDGEREAEIAPKRERKPRALTRPSGEVSPIAQAAAARVLREKGFL